MLYIPDLCLFVCFSILDKYVACIYHCNVLWNSLAALKVPSAPLMHRFLSLSLDSLNQWLLYCFINFAFSRMPYSWYHRVHSLFKLNYFTWHYVFKHHLCVFIT